jgi:adenylate cyclase
MKLTKESIKYFLKSIKFGLVFVNLIILILSFSFVIYYSQQSSNDAILQNTQVCMDGANKRLHEQILDSFLKVEKVITSCSSLFEDYPFAEAPVSKECRVLFGFLEQYNYITSIIFGKEDGSVVSAFKRSATDSYSTQPEKKLPANVKYAWKAGDAINKVPVTTTLVNTNNILPATRQATLTYIAQNGDTLDKETIPYNFDPRTRPWYEGAKNKTYINWTDVYIFTGSEKGPGITASYPLLSKTKEHIGVVGIDLSLKNMEFILTSNKTNKESNLYIIDLSGKIICSTEKLKQSADEDNAAQFASIHDAENAHLKYFIDSAEFNKQLSQSSYTIYNNVEFITQVEYFELGNLKWKILNVTPLQELLSAAKHKQRMTLFYSVIIMFFSALIMFLFGKNISGHISKLAIAAKRIETFDLGKSIEVSSYIMEIKNLTSSMIAMQKSVSSFAKYVPKDLVLKLLSQDSLNGIGGDTKELTMMFSDIANFTTISEKTKPQTLIMQLSEYFEALTQIVIDHQGTIDKYIGDSIMGFWGAPEKNERHAFDACYTALQMQSVLKVKNSEWVNAGLSPFHTRIGIHTGYVIVGNIGSDLRMNYTIIGDDVNLCSRLEGLNKMYQTLVIISEDTYIKVKGDFFVRPLGKVAVKGKNVGVPIYELIGCYKHVDPKLLLLPLQLKDHEKYQLAYSYFEQRKFDIALNIFLDIEIQDGPVMMMIEECKKLCITPPGDDWNGLFRSMHEK